MRLIFIERTLTRYVVSNLHISGGFYKAGHALSHGYIDYSAALKYAELLVKYHDCKLVLNAKIHCKVEK